MEVEITEFAECELKRIYSYYASVASPEIAHQIKNKIIDTAMRLSRLPYMGQMEQNLEDLVKDTAILYPAIIKSFTKSIKRLSM